MGPVFFFLSGRLMAGLLLMIYDRRFKGKGAKNGIRREKPIKNVIVLITPVVAI